MGNWKETIGLVICLAPTLVIGLVCLFLWHGIDEERAHDLEVYNNSVKAWNDPSTSPFFFTSGLWQISGGTTLELSVQTAHRDVPSLPSEGMKSQLTMLLEPQVLNNKSQPLYSPFIWPDSDDKEVQSLSLLYNGQVLFAQQIPVTYTVNTRTGTECVQDLCAGEPQNNLAYLVLRDVCFLVEDATQPYVHSTLGCAVDGTGVYTGNVLAYASFRQKPARYTAAGAQQLTLAVRSEEDPWVVAGQLTGGTFSFEPGAVERRYLLFTMLCALFAVGQALVLTRCCGALKGAGLVVRPASGVGAGGGPLIRPRPKNAAASLGGGWAAAGGARPPPTETYASLGSSLEEGKESYSMGSVEEEMAKKRSYFRTRLTNFYKLYNPKMVGSIDFLLEQYRGREVALLRNLEEKSFQDLGSLMADLPGISEDGEAQFEAHRGTLHSLEGGAEAHLDVLRRSYTQRLERRLQKKKEAYFDEEKNLLYANRAQRDTFAYTRLRSLFERFNPEGLGSLDFLLTQYKGREMQLPAAADHLKRAKSSRATFNREVDVGGGAGSLASSEGEAFPSSELYEGVSDGKLGSYGSLESPRFASAAAGNSAGDSGDEFDKVLDGRDDLAIHGNPFGTDIRIGKSSRAAPRLGIGGRGSASNAADERAPWAARQGSGSLPPHTASATAGARPLQPGPLEIHGNPFGASISISRMVREMHQQEKKPGENAALLSSQNDIGAQQQQNQGEGYGSV